ncbi:MAG: FkbM family methyltransferase [Flavobacteriales bacterium]|nr:FkbM family methyltransferase [Flavobacteriales bacterium]MCW8936494.1 FkbM family methyltransferase [Flavobacteriales bacterium]MCW8939956.1 FkbM family methyltransferase [Flavobacteriales bacterium]MCW8969198.1 FkbM family methyltransferase [Flavobacteriales bacterium]MCW8989549.1 FkbM family methyltransferase [Flavobacteriales bacterium]
MIKFTYYILRVLNKLVLKKHFASKNALFLFDYMHELAIEGLGYKNIGNTLTSGEKQVVELLNNHYKKTKNPITIFDVGANVGQYQRMLAENLNIPSNIYSFEPANDSFGILNTDKQNNVRNFQFGFGDKQQKVTLYKDENKSQLASIYKKTDNDYYNLKSMDIEETIYLRTIDDFCEEEKISKIDFLKLDIEGHEFFALKGAESMLSQNRINFIQFEFGPANIDSKTYLKDFYSLLSTHYSFYRLTKSTIIPLVNYSETNEIFLPSNYIAINKNKNIIL